MDMNEQIMLIHPLVWNREDDRDVRALFVRDLVVAARIGVHHQEQARTQNLRLNLCAYLRPPYDWQVEPLTSHRQKDLPVTKKRAVILYVYFN